MLERKNIDRVFQENLKDLEIFPHKRVWTNISREIQENQHKKPVPLWKKWSGAAAAIAALITGALFFYNPSQPLPVNNSNTGVENRTLEQEPQSPVNSAAASAEVVLANNEEEQNTENRSRFKEEPIFVKQPSNQVIVTTNDIATVYSNIENKYIVDKQDFIKELRSAESITERMESLPEKTEKAEVQKKWSVGPTVAPVFYNSVGDGSPITSILSENNKSTDNSMSYGVKVNYQLSEKLFIQSGINKVELAYNTKDVSAFISSSKNAPSNINSNKGGIYIAPTSMVQRISSPSTDALYKSNVTGDLNQSIEYVEFPIEMKYSLYDKRLGLNLVGGFSTLILSDNSLSLISPNSRTDLGNANNLNSLNFSGNVGVDLDYKISKSWYLNVAPMFKYQFNAYSGNTDNFRPYYFGLYSGLNYKF